RLASGGAGRLLRRLADGLRPERLRPDRQHHADRARGQERDPHRRVRQGQARAGRHADRGGRARVGAAALPSDPHDRLRVHPGRRAVDARQRRRCWRPERHGHRGVLGNAHRDGLGRLPHSRQLRLCGAARPSSRRRRPGARAAASPGPARARGAAGVRARALVAAAVLLAGCTVGPDYKRPPVQVPAAFRGGEPGAAVTPETMADLKWWELFQDQTLQGLIRIAMQENYDLRVAAARILDARAQVTIARSFQFPTVHGSAGANWGRTIGQRSPFQSEDTVFTPGGFDVGWELDFWGRFRRATEAARADLLSSEDARRFVMTTLVSDVASAYFQLRDFDLELEIARATLASRLDALRLVRLRVSGGVAAQIDAHQAEILVAQAGEVIGDARQGIEQPENALSVLLGKNPEAMPRGRPHGDQFAAPPAPPGIPSALLERRPDIRQAEADLHAATSRIGVAKAD